MMKSQNCLYFLLTLAISFACGKTNMGELKFDVQGHRGTRGLMPENTIPAFLKAIDLDVNTLEMDLAVTKNRELLISHEPFINPEYCLDKSGQVIPDSLMYAFNIYQMEHAEIKKFDCGSKPHPRFPEQQKMSAYKPLLSEVLSTVESYAKEKKLEPLRYNIEIKSMPQGDDLFHPQPDVFSDLVFASLNSKIDWSRITIQSFDFRILQYFHKTYPEVTLAVLIENDLTISRNLDSLGFVPQIYSCDFVLLSRANVNELHALGMKVIPWTVNEIADMNRLIDWNVDGLITDYPDRYNQIK
ncbi:MAG: glycerophosphoryl diester phosphodiesterase [Cyclobacteriaceae bacterium]|jgi:glycerophosphoryl diester phosphodiesterase